MTDVRESMEQAFEHIEAQSETPATPEPVVVVDAAPVETAPTPEAEVKPEPVKSPLDRARDEEGKFAKGKAKPSPKVVPEVKPVEPPAPDAPPDAAAAPPEPVAAPPAPTVKPPASWSPTAKEAFSKAPPEVQREVQKREAEITRTLQETAEARKTVDVVRQTLAPYEGLARANGMDTMKYAGSVLQTAAALSMGSQAQKAHVLATLIQSYGIDVDAINAVMQGQPAPQGQQQAPQLDPRQVVREEFAAMRQQAQQEQANRAWAEFQAGGHEFLDAVKDQMVVILSDAARTGKSMTYPQAYDAACRMNDEVFSVVSQRKAAEAARAPGTVTAATRAAASSVRSRPVAAPNGAQPKGVRGAMEAAAEKLGW